MIRYTGRPSQVFSPDGLMFTSRNGPAGPEWTHKGPGPGTSHAYATCSLTY